MTTISFENQVVIVTGAGGGLGRAYALELARRGAAVVVNDLGGSVEGGSGSSAMATQVVAEIRQQGGRAIASCDSVSTEAGAQAMVNMALETFGRVDAVINNAGNMRLSSLAEGCPEDLQALLSVHLFGSYFVTRAAWRVMQKQQYGRVLFTASSAGLFGNQGQGFYGTAKAAVFGLMNTFAIEGESQGILCNAILPFASSRMTEHAMQGMDEEYLKRTMPVFASLKNSTQPEFTAGLATYLVSNVCRSTHGLYSSCGGRMARAFVGVTRGWQGSREVAPDAETIAEHFAEITALDTEGFSVPQSPSDELKQVLMESS